LWINHYSIREGTSVLATTVLFYGEETPLPEQVPLRAGPLSLVYEGGDLRYIRLGEHEVLRRVYAAVRDRNWGTVPAIRSAEQVEAGPDSFRITYQVSNRQGDIDFHWTAELSGTADGTIRFVFDGVAHSMFLRNRIGLCVLHPAEAAGASAVVERDDGERIAAHLPDLITPDQPPQPFTDMRALEHEVAPGITARVAFEGDLFELEDQRNWTDASFKTFSTPLRLPFPVEVPAGTRVRQEIVITLKDERRTLKTASGHGARRDELTFSVQRSAFILPPLGLMSHGKPLSEREAARLRALRLAHLRTELDLTQPGVETALARATAEARLLDLPLELALLVPDEPRDALRRLRAALEQERPAVAAWLIYAANERLRGGTPIEMIVAAARELLGGYAAAPFAAGTNADYILAGRNPPPAALLERFCVAITPQVHAFDLASVTETLAAQSALVRSAARTFGLPVSVSPVTFMPRGNPYATGAPVVPPPEQLPPTVDVRQMSLYGAGWTTGSIKHLAEAGAASVTYYETTGWRGVMEREAGSPLPERFRSIPGAVFPLYHALADIGEFAGGEVRGSISSAPLRFDGLALRQGGRARVLLASFTNAMQHVRVEGLAGLVQLRTLDATNAEAAMREPEAFRAANGPPHEAQGGTLTVELPPFAVARLDWNEAGNGT
jgi:D-apionolactonase